MDWQQPRAFVSKEKGSAAREGMILNGLAALPNLNAADFDSLLVELLATSLKRRERLVLDLLISALVAEHVELL